MRKRIPKYAGGQVHMSDMDKKILREFQTQGQVGDNISESQLKGLEGAITGSYITPRDVTYTPQEEERFKKLMSGRVGRRFDKGQGAQGMGILQRRFPNISDSDMMNLIDMYSQDAYVNPFDKPTMNFGGSSNKKLPKAQYQFQMGQPEASDYSGLSNFFGYITGASDNLGINQAFRNEMHNKEYQKQKLLELGIIENLEEKYPRVLVEEKKPLIFMDQMEQKKRGGAKKKDWIKGAIKHPGALTAAAKRAGGLKKDGTIKKSWLQQQAKKGNSKTARRARLALTLGKMKK